MTNEVGKTGNNLGVQINNLGAGLKRANINPDDTAQLSIFYKIDTNKDGVIDEQELNDFKSQLDNKDQDNTVTNKEANKYLKNAKKEGLDKNIKQEDLNKFLENYQVNTSNVESAKTIEQNGKTLVQIKYKDGSEEFVNSDGSSILNTKQDDGSPVTNFLDSNGHCYKAQAKDENNSTVTTLFDENGNAIENQTLDENGTLSRTELGPGNIPVKTIITNKEQNATAVITYDDAGNPVARQDKSGTATVNYTYDADGNEQVQSSIENEGIPALEKKSVYTTNADGSVSVKITEAGTKTDRTLINGRPVYEEITDADGGVTYRTYTGANGAHIDEKKENGVSTASMYNARGELTGKSKVVDGNTYTASYDGKGNTKVVVQNGETLEAIAKKFNVSVDDLKKANNLEGNKKFGVAQEIIIPNKEIEPDDVSLKGRKSKEEVVADYNRAQEKKAVARAQDKALRENLGLKNYNGKGQKITAKAKENSYELTIVGEASTNGRRIATNGKGKYFTISHPPDNVILDDGYIMRTKQFSSGKKVEVKDANGKTVQFAEVQDMGKGRKLVVDSKGQYHVMSAKNTILKNSYLQRDALADEISKDPKKAATVVSKKLTNDIDKAEAAFEAQMKKDGICADVADAAAHLWLSENTADSVRADFKKLKSLSSYSKLYSEGDVDYKHFSDYFKETYGVNFDEKAVAEYYRNPTKDNLTKAFGSSRLADLQDRVRKYNQSQDDGAAAVKFTGCVIATATMGPAGASLMSATIVAADAATSEQTREDIMNGDVETIARVGTELAMSGLPYGSSKLLGSTSGKMASGYVGKILASTSSRIGVKVSEKVAQKVGTEVVREGFNEAAFVSSGTIQGTAQGQGFWNSLGQSASGTFARVANRGVLRNRLGKMGVNLQSNTGRAINKVGTKALDNATGAVGDGMEFINDMTT